MSEKKQMKLKGKVSDYKNFSIVLLFVSAFFSMGAVVPFQGRTGFDEVLLSVAGIVLMIAAGFFYVKSGLIKQQVEKEQV